MAFEADFTTALMDVDLLFFLRIGSTDFNIMEVVENAVGWQRLWDLALDNGHKCVHGLN